METMKWLETALRLLREHLSSDHAILQLHRQTVNFVSATHDAPFVPRHSAQKVISQIVSENPSATVLLYAPAGFGKTTLLSKWMCYQILRKIAEGLAEIGRYDEAIEIADSIEPFYPKGGILSDVAQAAASSGDIERARQIFERAKSVVGAEDLMFISDYQAEV